MEYLAIILVQHLPKMLALHSEANCVSSPGHDPDILLPQSKQRKFNATTLTITVEYTRNALLGHSLQLLYAQGLQFIQRSWLATNHSEHIA